MARGRHKKDCTCDKCKARRMNVVKTTDTAKKPTKENPWLVLLTEAEKKVTYYEKHLAEAKSVYRLIAKRAA